MHYSIRPYRLLTRKAHITSIAVRFGVLYSEPQLDMHSLTKTLTPTSPNFPTRRSRPRNITSLPPLSQVLRSCEEDIL